MTKLIAALLFSFVVSSIANAEDDVLPNFLASGNWGSYSLGQDGSRAIAYTNIEDIVMSIDFEVSDCSKSYLTIHVGKAKISDIGKSELIHRDIKLRVDTRDIWSVDEVESNVQQSHDGRSAVIGVSIPVNSEFLNEMRHGTMLRIKIQDISAFRTSLTGSRGAIDRASTLCQKTANAMKNDDRYFEQRKTNSADDEAYF